MFWPETNPSQAKSSQHSSFGLWWSALVAVGFR